MFPKANKTTRPEKPKNRHIKNMLLMGLGSFICTISFIHTTIIPIPIIKETMVMANSSHTMERRYFRCSSISHLTRNGPQMFPNGRTNPSKVDNNIIILLSIYCTCYCRCCSHRYSTLVTSCHIY